VQRYIHEVILSIAAETRKVSERRKKDFRSTLPYSYR
jgi:hypothetical protein